jgi:hypothetical protein
MSEKREDKFVCEACAYMTFNSHEEYMEHNREVQTIMSSISLIVC